MQSLARKFRPAKFSEMLGQEAVVTALQNAIKIGRLPQGVIFSGVRGVGKTTVARLYAKALNCSSDQPFEPCNQCDNCLATAKGIHEDVIEIDGASNTGVDDIRAIQESLNYVPQRASCKVYIIDEVHMLSQSAFNALLKTLEEPPKHVVFLFATTELKKVPATILSRCQTYHLQLIPLSTIVARLEDVLHSEGIEYEKAAVEIIAKEGKGSLRDSLTILDQAIALSGGKVQLENLEGFLDTKSSALCLKFLAALIERDPGSCLVTIQTWDENGASFRAMMEEVAVYARHAFVIKGLGVEALDTAFLGLAKDELSLLDEFANKAQDFDLNRIFRTLVKCRGDLDGAVLDRYVVENYVLEWCLDPGLPDLDQLSSALQGGALTLPRVGDATAADVRQPRKVKNLKEAWKKTIAEVGGKPEEEKKTLSSEDQTARTPTELPADPPCQPAAELLNSARENPVETSFPTSWRELVDSWRAKQPLQAAILDETYAVNFSPDLIEVLVEGDSLAATKLLQKNSHDKLVEQLQELFGFRGRFVVQVKELGAEPSGESILETRQRERQEAKQALIKQVSTHPLTKEALELFNGRIGQVEITSLPS